MAHALTPPASRGDLPRKGAFRKATPAAQVAPGVDEEKLATCFARHLLMPVEPIRVAVGQAARNHKLPVAKLLDVAREFDVSAEAPLWHLAFLYGRSEEETRADIERVKRIAELFDERMRDAPPSRPLRFVRLAVTALHRGEISAGKFAEYLGITRKEAERFANEPPVEDEGSSSYRVWRFRQVKHRGLGTGPIFRPLHPVRLPEQTEVEVVLPEIEIDEWKMARRRSVGEMHRRLEPIDVRPLTTGELVREAGTFPCTYGSRAYAKGEGGTPVVKARGVLEHRAIAVAARGAECDSEPDQETADRARACRGDRERFHRSRVSDDRPDGPSGRDLPWTARRPGSPPRTTP